MVSALHRELKLRSNEISGPVHTIYFGGGTPSLLESEELLSLMQVIDNHYQVVPHPEVTLEANPDDIHKSKLKGWRKAGINRLSIGIQTFDESRLKFINRAHSRAEALNALHLVKDEGFQNITADLIYAIPPEDIKYWEHDLNTILRFELPHLSIYGLTIEENTVFGRRSQRGEFPEVPEDTAARQYQLAMEMLKGHGYDHYEVSNFAIPGFYSKHNSAYWDDQVYLGIGPGAHSYDGIQRSFNVSNNAVYLRALEEDKLPKTTDPLTLTDRANEYLLTHIRTSKGVDLNHFGKTFNKDLVRDFEESIEYFTKKGLMHQKDNRLILTSSGFLLADEISLRLFYDA